ncbi:hypothetical protein ACETRX_20095 [Labrys portucalensis]|uniref:Uncharacterized protein n=1 Tax=Labrys neptuniae TaxID=376174 RepID=A0ABV6ZIC3_9HYPH
MSSIIKRKICIRNETENEIRVVIEPYWEERSLSPNNKIHIDLRLHEHVDMNDQISISHYNDAIVLFQDGDIDMEFSDTPENEKWKP